MGNIHKEQSTVLVEWFKECGYSEDYIEQILPEVENLLSSSASFLCSAILFLLFTGPICFVTTAPIEMCDSSGYDKQSSKLTTLMSEAEKLTKGIRAEAVILNNEICKQITCNHNMEIVVQMPTLPKITEQDGCFPCSTNTPFCKNKCLHNIFSSLVEFHSYLVYVNKTDSETQKTGPVESIRQKVRILADYLRTKRHVNEHTTRSPLPELPSKDGWEIKTTSHRILKSLIELLETTSRVLRLIKNNNLVLKC
ncbi:interleukin-6 [Bombina bombina]|uniref:interleukin-6 n=1 Tax=Bombina bombina TaxID=8345 RepID=UPI00235A890E|nr:interleukin-6 [Bombina bombina]